MRKFIAVFLVFLGATPSALAHGEDKPGPHGGHVRMPGAFHTEVLWEDGKGIKVYLLDLEFKNPTTKDSSLQVSLKEGGKVVPMSCDASGDHFVCRLPGGPRAGSGELHVKAVRAGSSGAAMRYPLPLTFPKGQH